MATMDEVKSLFDYRQGSWFYTGDLEKAKKDLKKQSIHVSEHASSSRFEVYLSPRSNPSPDNWEAFGKAPNIDDAWRYAIGGFYVSWIDSPKDTQDVEALGDSLKPLK